MNYALLSLLWIIMPIVLIHCTYHVKYIFKLNLADHSLLVRLKTFTILSNPNYFLQCTFKNNSINMRILLGIWISNFPDNSWNFKINFSFFKKILIFLWEIPKLLIKFYFIILNSKFFQKIPNWNDRQNSDIFQFFY